MQTHVKVFAGILVVGVLGILGAKFALPLLRDARQQETSDAAATRGTLRIGVDNWVGYFPLCSPQMIKRVRHAGYVIRCEDDRSDLDTRFKKLDGGELDFAVATVDSYLLRGATHNFPGAIIAVIDESKGGDAIVARKSVVQSLDALKQKPEVRIAYTPDSPSEHLLKSIATHFDLPQLKTRQGSWRIAADGSTDALAKLQAGKADVAVLWEPDVTRALTDPAYVKLIGTEDTDNLIVDTLIASRRSVQTQPQAIAVLLDQYFQTLRQYRDDPALLRADLREATSLGEDRIEPMLKGVEWASLNDNGARWFGVSQSGLPGEERLIDAIRSTTGILIEAGDFAHSPLPNEDPYRITNRSFLSTLYLAQPSMTATAGGGTDSDDSLTHAFAPLDDKGWLRLKEVGTLKVEPIAFQRGTATMDEDDREVVDRIVERLRHYPNYRILVRGHTGVGGEDAANVTLSQQRAAAVSGYLQSNFHIDGNRIRAVGFGGSRPLPKLPDESDRAWGYRLPRVEILLVADPF